MHAGIAVCLGFADVVDTYSLSPGGGRVGDPGKGVGQKESWKRVFWLEVSFAAVALVILAFGVRIKRAESEMTVDEREAEMGLEMETRNLGSQESGVSQS